MLKMLIMVPAMLMSASFNMMQLTNMLLLLLFLSLLGFSTEFSVSPNPSLFTSISNFNSIMVSLTIFISVAMCIISMKYQTLNKSPKLFNLSLVSLMFIVIIFFTTDNLLTLYIMFELSLIPTLVMILKWGYQPERLQSSYYFMLYTICASLPLLFGISWIYKVNQSLSLTNTYPLNHCTPSFNYFIVSMCFMTAFMVKLPSWGMHLWLPKAHVEAPISGSMILAGILLKLGGYGLIKMMKLLPTLNLKTLYFYTSINIWGAMVIGLVCLSSMDMKVMIAYSSVIHMNLMVAGLLSKTQVGLLGAMMMMISHGFSSPGMFALANLNYEKTFSRNILMNKGLGPAQPSVNMLWFLVIAANMAAPPSLNLISEILISMSILKMTFVFSLILGMITFLAAAYNLYIYSSQQSNNMLSINQFNKTPSSHYLAILPLTVMPFLMVLLLDLCS